MLDRLRPDDLTALADLIADRLLDGGVPAPPARLIDAGEVARRFAVSAQWARDHADELGAVRLGDGPRPRLRFDPAKVTAALTARQTGETSNGPATLAVPPGAGARRRRRTVAGSQLLPMRGAKA